MTPAKPRLMYEEEGDILVASFRVARVIDQIMIREIQAEFDVLVGEVGARKVVLDFSGVEALSSSALGAIVSLNDRLRASGGQLKLAALNDDVAHLLSLTRLDRVLTVYPDRDDAVEAFR